MAWGDGAFGDFWRSGGMWGEGAAERRANRRQRREYRYNPPDPYDVLDEAEEEAEEQTEGLYDKLDEATDLIGDFQGVDEYFTDQGITPHDLSGDLTAIEALIAQIQGGPTAQQYDDAFAHGSRIMGLTPQEYDDIIGTLTERLSGYEPGMTPDDLRDAGLLGAGMSDQERALRQRENQSNLRMATDRAQRLVQDSMADSGSMARMLRTADEATHQINNMQLQQDAALAQEEAERAMVQLQSQMTTWQTMMSTQQMGVDQYINNIMEGAGLAFQGYATRMNAMLQENQQYLQMYQLDQQAITNQISAIYDAIHAEIGINEHEINLVRAHYEEVMQPWIDFWTNELAVKEATFGWDDVFGFIGDGINAFLSGFGEAVGTGGGGGSGPTGNELPPDNSTDSGPVGSPPVYTG